MRASAAQVLIHDVIPGWYTDVGLDVTLLSPHTDAYATTPAQRVASGEADLAITPAETVVSSHTQPPGSIKPRLTVCWKVLMWGWHPNSCRMYLMAHCRREQCRHTETCRR